MDIISDAFSIFDFSFIVSGGFLLILISGVLWRFNRLSFLNGLNIIYTIPVIIILIYLMGLMAWSIGKPIRESLIGCPLKKSFWKYPHEKRDEDFEEVIKSLGVNLTTYKNKLNCKEADNKLLYSIMWSELSSSNSSNVKERISICNRYWVMQAVFEGLVTDFIVCIIVAILLISCKKIEWTTFIFAEVTSFVCFKASVHRAHYYAKSQIQEIVADYIVFCNTKDK